MQLPQVFISKQNLDTLPKRDRILLIQISMVLTDINVFQKLMVYAYRNESRDTLIKRANMQISLNLIFILCGKLLEGWKLIDTRTINERFSKKMKERKDFFCEKNWFPKEYGSQLSVEGIKSLNYLKEYFKRSDNKIETIRNKIASHYDPEEIEKYLERLNRGGIVIYLPKNQNWHFFSNANNIFINGFLDEINSASKEVAFKEFSDEIIKVSSSVRILVMDYLKIIADKYLADAETTIVEIPDPELEDKMYIDFFS